jgi:hypothetical protein
VGWTCNERYAPAASEKPRFGGVFLFSVRYNPAAMPNEIVLLNTLRALVEVAALMLLLRGVMWIFGPKARTNFIYGIFTVGSMPFIRFARKVTPRAVDDRYVPLIAFLLLFSLWVALVLTAQALCARPGVQCA